MTTYNLSKGPNNDTNGRVLHSWIENHGSNVSNITIIDNGAATIENMYMMFSDADLTGFKYVSVNLSGLNTANVTDMVSMFAECTRLTDISNFDTSNVTNMNGMFETCYKLTNIPEFDTSNVTDMSVMFVGCSQLTDVPEYNTAKVTNMVGMFEGCNNLSNATIQNIVNMCINSNVPSNKRNLSTDNEFSPLYDTKFDNSYYTNRLSDLTNAGWSYEYEEEDE
jgi:surface protein